MIALCRTSFRCSPSVSPSRLLTFFFFLYESPPTFFFLVGHKGASRRGTRRYEFPGQSEPAMTPAGCSFRKTSRPGHLTSSDLREYPTNCELRIAANPSQQQTMALPCRFAARSCARQLRAATSPRSSAQMLRASCTTRRYNSTEAAAANPKIADIVDQISKLTLLETADLVSSLKVNAPNSTEAQRHIQSPMVDQVTNSKSIK